jgi:hypothetical protein
MWIMLLEIALYLKLLDGGSENFECEAKQTNFLKIEKS